MRLTTRLILTVLMTFSFQSLFAETPIKWEQLPMLSENQARAVFPKPQTDGLEFFYLQFPSEYAEESTSLFVWRSQDGDYKVQHIDSATIRAAIWKRLKIEPTLNIQYFTYASKNYPRSLWMTFKSWAAAPTTPKISSSDLWELLLPENRSRYESYTVNQISINQVAPHILINNVILKVVDEMERNLAVIQSYNPNWNRRDQKSLSKRFEAADAILLGAMRQMIEEVRQSDPEHAARVHRFWAKEERRILQFYLGRRGLGILNQGILIAVDQMLKTKEGTFHVGSLPWLIAKAIEYESDPKMRSSDPSYLRWLRGIHFGEVQWSFEGNVMAMNGDIPVWHSPFRAYDPESACTELIDDLSTGGRRFP